MTSLLSWFRENIYDWHPVVPVLPEAKGDYCGAGGPNCGCPPGACAINEGLAAAASPPPATKEPEAPSKA